MKRVFLVIVVLLAASIMVYAQAADRPTSSQTKQEAQQYLAQARTNSAQFESTFDDHNTRSTSNRDADTFQRLKKEIDSLEANINAAQNRSNSSLNNGEKENPTLKKQINQLIEQHRAKQAELEAFISNTSTNTSTN